MFLLSRLKLKDKLFYGWVLVATFLIVGTTIWGIRFSFGVFFKSIEGEFNLTRTTTSTVFSLYLVLGGVFTVLGGWALDRYGPRLIILLMGLFTGFSLLLVGQTHSLWQLFITYSLLLSTGTSAIYVVIMSTVSRWFDKKRGLALGIAGSGAGLGTVVMAPFATFLIANFDWRMAYMILGLVAWLIVMPLSRLLKKDPGEVGVLPDGEKADSMDSHPQESKIEVNSLKTIGLSLSQAFRTRSFWLVIFIWLLFASSLLLVIAHLVPYATDIGISVADAATVLSLLGGVSIIGRVLMGRASDRIGRKVTASICALLQVGALVWLAWSRELWMFYLFALVFGFNYGGLTPALTALVGDTFGLRNFGMLLGVLEVGWGVGAAIGPVIGGLIFDVSGSYFTAFLIAAFSMLIAAMLITLIRREHGGGSWCRQSQGDG